MVGVDLHPTLLSSHIHPPLPGPAFARLFTLIGSLLKVFQVVGVHQALHGGRVVHDLLRLYPKDPHAGGAHEGKCPPSVRKDGILINNRRQIRDQILHGLR